MPKEKNLELELAYREARYIREQLEISKPQNGNINHYDFTRTHGPDPWTQQQVFMDPASDLYKSPWGPYGIGHTGYGTIPTSVVGGWGTFFPPTVNDITREKYFRDPYSPGYGNPYGSYGFRHTGYGIPYYNPISPTTWSSNDIARRDYFMDPYSPGYGSPYGPYGMGHTGYGIPYYNPISPATWSPMDINRRDYYMDPMSPGYGSPYGPYGIGHTGYGSPIGSIGGYWPDMGYGGGTIPIHNTHGQIGSWDPGGLVWKPLNQIKPLNYSTYYPNQYEYPHRFPGPYNPVQTYGFPGQSLQYLSYNIPTSVIGG